jgi:hypothetical protein
MLGHVLLSGLQDALASVQYRRAAQGLTALHAVVLPACSGRGWM